MFYPDRRYTRSQIRALIGVPGTRGGNFDTGHARYNGDHFIFCGIDIPGRTGHNYNNYFDGDVLVWHPRDRAKLTTPALAELVSGKVRVHVFWRAGERDAFTYAGVGVPALVQTTTPIEVRWSFRSAATGEQVSDDANVPEGARRQITVNAYERDRIAKSRCIRRWGTACTVCTFDFGIAYGDLGTDFIHVHHLRPLHTIGKQYELNPEADLRPVCPNCHSMLHRGDPVLSIEELRARLNFNFAASVSG